MKQVETKPESGQFVAVWVFNNRLWSAPFKWSGDRLYRYSPDSEDDCRDDEWKRSDIPLCATDISFFILD